MPNRLLAATAILVSLTATAAAQDQSAPIPQPAPPAAAAPATPAPGAPSPTTVVAKVGAATITEGELSQAAEDFAEQLARAPAEQRRQLLINVLVDMKLLAQAAAEAGLDKSEDFERRLELLRLRALRNAYVKSRIVDTVDDATLKAEYDAQVKSFQPQDEVRARHILVKTKEEADAVLKALGGGSDFAVLAEEKSIDPSAKGRGGDLGYFARGQMVPQFDTAAFALNAGETTKEAVETQFGFHVIKVEDKRKSAPPSIDEVKDQLRNVVITKAFQARMEELKAKYPVEIVGLPPAAPAAPAAAPAAPAAPALAPAAPAPAPAN